MVQLLLNKMHENLTDLKTVSDLLLYKVSIENGGWWCFVLGENGRDASNSLSAAARDLINENLG